MSPSESHDQEKMELGIVPSPTNPVTTNPQPTNPESSETQIKVEDEQKADKRKLLPTDSSLSVPPFPYSFRSEEPTPSESAPSSPRPPPQPPRQAQTHIPQSPADDDDEDGPDPTHPILKIADKQELGKAVIVLAVPMVMGLVTTNNSFAKTTEMKVVAVTLCFAFAFISNGILLRRTYRRASAVVLMVGIALMMLSLYAYLGCILPIYLKWVPVACWVVSVFPLVTVFVAFICSRMKKKEAKVASKERDLEKGEA